MLRRTYLSTFLEVVQDLLSGGLPRGKPRVSVTLTLYFRVVLQKWQNPLARKLGRPLRDIFLRGVLSPLAAELGE